MEEGCHGLQASADDEENDDGAKSHAPAQNPRIYASRDPGLRENAHEDDAEQQERSQ